MRLERSTLPCAANQTTPSDSFFALAGFNLDRGPRDERIARPAFHLRQVQRDGVTVGVRTRGQGDSSSSGVCASTNAAISTSRTNPPARD